MKLVICLALVFLAAVPDCQCYGVSTRRGSHDSRRYRGPYAYRNSYRRRTCQVRGCSSGYTCRRREVVARSSELRCLPDIRSVVRSRLSLMEKFWNGNDFNSLANLFTKDSVFLPPGLEISRGTEGFAEFLAGWKSDNKWGDLKWTLDKVESSTDDFLSSISFFELQSVVNAPLVIGKSLFLWKRIGATYFIDTTCFNFDPPKDKKP